MARRRRRARGRRSRELSRLVIPAVAAAVVLAFLVGALSQVGRGSGPYHRTVDQGFAALAGTVSGQSDATASSFGSLLARAPTLPRISLFSGLDQAAAATAVEARRLESAVPPSPEVDGGCFESMEARATATATIRTELEGLLGGSSGGPGLAQSSVVASVQRAAVALDGSDADWAACRRALQAAAGGARLGASKWTSDAALWTAPALAALVSAVGSSPSLVARPALQVTAVDTDPGPIPAPAGMEVPPTTQLSVHVVASDSGNVDEPAVQVRAALMGASTKALSSIVALRAGRSATVLLGPFTVEPGSAYTLQVTAATPGGVSTSASWALQVATVPATTTTTTTTTTTSPASRRSATRSTVTEGP